MGFSLASQSSWVLVSAAAAVAAVALGLTVVGVGSAATATASHAGSRHIIRSPRETLLPHLSKERIARLAYGPDHLPGARDVETPYGSMRIYEWGHDKGRKVLFVHGDATPSPMFKPIAETLVAKGCRVMMFDLWGRGYSDTPADCRHDSRLYSSQILYALHSSPVMWTGKDVRFSLIGFSLGGSILLDFFSQHPSLVEGIVLLGPGGLIRALPSEYQRVWFRWPSLTTDTTMRRLIGALLGVNVSKAAGGAEMTLPEGEFTPAKALQFQYDCHHGHMQSFLSTIRYGPLQHQEATWESAARLLRSDGQERDVLVICGDSDSVVPAADVRQDLERYLGMTGKFVFKTVPGGHGFPWSEGPTIARHVVELWGL